MKQHTVAAVGVGTSTLLSISLMFATPAQAASVIDLPQAGGNTVQFNGGPATNVFQPQFSLWPLPPVSNDVRTDGNEAVDRGNDTVGEQWLFGVGAGNVVQVGTGGNIFAPQLALGTDNNAELITFGNWAEYTGNNSETVTGGQRLGTVINGNGNVFQVEFFQGNIVAPQVAVLGDNNLVADAQGNTAYVVGNDSVLLAENAGMLAFIDGNGNVVQISILSNNVIAPQFVVGGTNDVVVESVGNDVDDAGNRSATVLTGVFSINTTKTGNGNVTQISILSNNVWAPQIALPGKNVAAIDTDANSSTNAGNESLTDIDPSGDLAPSKHPILTALTGKKEFPKLEAFEDEHPEVQPFTRPLDGRSQIGNGNTLQDANASGAIVKDPSVAVGTLAVKLDAKPKVRTSLFAKPGSTDTDTTAAKPRPIKDALTKLRDSLKPKPKADAPAADADSATE